MCSSIRLTRIAEMKWTVIRVEATGSIRLTRIAEMKWKVIQAEAAGSSWQRCGNMVVQWIAMAKCRLKQCRMETSSPRPKQPVHHGVRCSASPSLHTKKCRRGSFGAGKSNEMNHLFSDVQYRKHLYPIDSAAEGRPSDRGQRIGHLYSPRAARVRCAASMPVMLSPSLPFK